MTESNTISTEDQTITKTDNTTTKAEDSSINKTEEQNDTQRKYGKKIVDIKKKFGFVSMSESSTGSQFGML